MKSSFRCIASSAVLAAVYVGPAWADCVQSNGDGFDLKGGVALHLATGLEWRRCAVGMEWSGQDEQCVGETSSLTWDEAQEAAKQSGEGWRLPSGEELDSLLIDTCEGPKIDGRVFPIAAGSDFGDGAEVWSTSLALPPNMYYYFNFTHGYVDMHSSGFHLTGMLVRKP